MAASCKVKRMLDIGAVRADRLPLPVDDDLRRVNRCEMEERRVAVLTLGRLVAGIRVLPAEPVPVIDVKRQGQHIGTAREFGEQLVGWWAR